MTRAYYIGTTGSEDNSTEQARLARALLLSGKADAEIIAEFSRFLCLQAALQPDTVRLVNQALMAHYGAEAQGLGEDDYEVKANFFRTLLQKFPEECSFKISYAECCLLAGLEVADFFPQLKEGLLQDASNQHYPSADMFAALHESTYSFAFDLLLLDKYYQPCSKEAFDEWIRAYKEEYTTAEQQATLEKIQWKGSAKTSTHEETV